MFNTIFNSSTTYSDLKEYVASVVGNYPGDIVTPNDNNIKTHEWSDSDISISEDYLHPTMVTCYVYFTCSKCNLLICRFVDFDLLTGCSIRIEHDWHIGQNPTQQVPDCNAVIMQEALE